MTGSSVGIDVAVEVSVITLVGEATSDGAAEVFKAGMVTSRGRDVFVANTWATTVGCTVFVDVEVEVVVATRVRINDGETVGVTEGELVFVGSGARVGVLDTNVDGDSVLVANVARTAAAVST